MSHYKKLTTRTSELQKEYSLVEEKISLLLSRKNKAIVDMRNMLQELQDKNNDLEEQLDEYRRKRIG